MHYFNELKIENYLLKVIDIIDLDSSYFQALNDHEHMRWSRQRRTRHDIYSSKTYIDDLKSHGEFVGVYDSEKSKLIGTITIRVRDESAQLGFLIFPQCANRGTLSTILPHLKDELHNTYNLEFLYIGTNSQNIGMRRVAEKSGFSEVSAVKLNNSLLPFVGLSEDVCHYLSVKSSQSI